MPIRRALLLALVSTCLPALSHAAELPRPVRTITVTETPAVETIIQTGEIRPRRETDLGFRIDGRLTQRAVEIGRAVRIVTIAPRDIEVTVSLTSNPAIRVTGQVRQVSPAADPRHPLLPRARHPA